MSSSNADVNTPLFEKRICILAPRDASLDGRLLKEVDAFKNAGADVMVVYRGRAYYPELLRPDVRWVALMGQPDFVHPRLGAPSVWRPIRILVNLTFTKFKLWNYRMRKKRDDLTFFDAKAMRVIVDNNPDVIQANDVYTLATGYEAAKCLDAKLVYNPYELFEGYFNDLGMQAKADQIERKYAGMSDLIVAAWPGIKRSLQEENPEAEIIVELNSLPNEKIEVHEVCHPIRLVSQGGIRRITHDINLVKAMKYLQGKAHLTIQGKSADDEHLAEIKQYIIKNKLEDCVDLTGSFESKESVRLLQGFDIGLSVFLPDTPSKDQTLSNRFFTYMNAGLAIVASNTTGHREFPEINQFAILVDPASPKAIAEGILSLLDNRHRIQKMRTSAKNEFEKYSWEIQEKKLIEAYSSMFRE